MEPKNNYTSPIINIVIIEYDTSIATSGVGFYEEMWEGFYEK